MIGFTYAALIYLAAVLAIHLWRQPRPGRVLLAGIGQLVGERTPRSAERGKRMAKATKRSNMGR